MEAKSAKNGNRRESSFGKSFLFKKRFCADEGRFINTQIKKRR